MSARWSWWAGEPFHRLAAAEDGTFLLLSVYIQPQKLTRECCARTSRGSVGSGRASGTQRGSVLCSAWHKIGVVLSLLCDVGFFSSSSSFFTQSSDFTVIWHLNATLNFSSSWKNTYYRKVWIFNQAAFSTTSPGLFDFGSGWSLMSNGLQLSLFLSGAYF